MDDSKRAGAQIYGYTVCVVAIITILFSTGNLVNSILNLSDPIHSGYTPEGTPSMASFDNYKMDMLRTMPKDGDAARSSYQPNDETLKAMYQAAREDKIQKVRHDSISNIIVCSILMLICITLFFTHFRWMRNLAKMAS